MNQDILKRAVYALDLSQALLEKSNHHKTILAAYNELKSLETPIKLVPILQLFDHEGKQVCDLGVETCHFYVLPTRGGKSGASCNHCQRGIPNNRPHRLCPVLKETA